jgi:hypothetical protein
MSISLPSLGAVQAQEQCLLAVRLVQLNSCKRGCWRVLYMCLQCQVCKFCRPQPSELLTAATALSPKEILDSFRLLLPVTTEMANWPVH